MEGMNIASNRVTIRAYIFHLAFLYDYTNDEARRKLARIDEMKTAYKILDWELCTNSLIDQGADGNIILKLI